VGVLTLTPTDQQGGELSENWITRVGKGGGFTAWGIFGRGVISRRELSPVTGKSAVRGIGSEPTSGI